MGLGVVGPGVDGFGVVGPGVDGLGGKKTGYYLNPD